MVDTINELSELSRKLNQKSDEINSIITSINQKLEKLNLGLEVWFEDEEIEVGDTCDTDENGNPSDPWAVVTLLGYCRTSQADAKSRWELVIKTGTRYERKDDFGRKYHEYRNFYQPTSLLMASRETRIEALKLIPRFLDVLKMKGEELLAGIEAARRVSEKL